MGSSVTRLLADRGAHVFVTARDGEAVESLADEVGGSARPGDATDAAFVKELVDEAAEAGELRGVANFAGSLLIKPAHLTTPDELDHALDQNVRTAFNLVRAAAPALRDGGGGSVLLVTSAAARSGIPNHEAIAAAKGAVASMARSAAATYARWNVRVNAVAPGLVATPMTTRITDNDKARAHSEGMHALGRLGEPGDVAHAAAWLLSEEASWVTGQIVGVDGGLATLRSS
jgi:NAD(P)-dependent dehydrogenase (short-subunit alcohol dehydrogenase family)